MKKKLSLLALVMCVLAACFAFVACGEQTPDGGNEPGTSYTYKLNKTAETLDVGGSVQLSVTVTPQKEITPVWTVSPAGVVTVSDSGLVTAVAAGTATVKATVDGKELTCAVTVGATEYNYSLNKTEETLYVEDWLQLNVIVTPQKDVSPVWTAEPAGVVTVDEDGLVTAVAEGTATVKATVDGRELTCAITVEAAQTLYTYTLSKEEHTFEMGVMQFLSLTIECTPTREDLAVTWESRNAEIAKVEAKPVEGQPDMGFVTPIAAGETYIDAKVDGAVVASCKITVIQYVYTVPETLSVPYGDTTKSIAVTVQPEKQTNLSFVVEEGKDNIITVDGTGKITTVGVGSATVTVKDGTRTIGTCAVTVSPNIQVTKTLAMHSGESKNITVTVSPQAEVTAEYAVKSGADVVSVSSDGAVTALKDGTAVVTVTVDGTEYECAVTVSNVLVNGLTITQLEMDKEHPIDITEGAEYWEQYIAFNEVNHKQYSSADEDIIENVFPIVNGKIHYLADYKAWLAWHGGATKATCTCGKCGKDTQNGGDGGWTNNGTKSYFSLENGTSADKRTDLLDVKHTFNIKVFPGVSTVKIYTGGYLMKARVDVKLGASVIATETFEHNGHESDLLALIVDVKEATAITLDFVITEFTGAGNGFISFAAASVSGDVYRLDKYNVQLKPGETEKISATKNGAAFEGASFTSSDESVATVTADGTVAAVAPGDAVITATVDGRARKVTVKVRYEYTPYEAAADLVVGTTHQINVTSNPAGSTQTLVYESNDTEIATVDNTGLVTAVGKGSTTIDIKVEDEVVATVRISVRESVTVTEKLVMHVGETKNIEVISDETELTISYAVTSGTNVASVSDSGTVTAIANGTAVVTVTVNGDEYACSVTVENVHLTDLDVTVLEKNKDNPIDITVGAEYWEQYIAAGEINHKHYDTIEEDIIERTYSLQNNAAGYLPDYPAFLAWHGGATGATCSCGKCNKDSQYGGDGGWDGDRGNKAFLTGDNKTVVGDTITFDVKVFAGVSVIKIYTGTFRAMCEAKVMIGETVLGTKTFGNLKDTSFADLVAVTVDVKDPTTVKVILTATEIVDNGFLSLAGAAVCADEYKLSKTSTRIVPGDTENIVINKNNAAYAGEASYVSSDENVVTVSAEGVVAGVGAGRAVITVTVAGRVRKFAVDVGYDYNINKENVSLLVGGTQQLVVASEPAGSTAAVTYTSNDTGIATVSDSGLITAVAEGETTITVDVDGSTFTVKVVVAKAAVTASDRSFKGDFVDLTRPEVVYWKQYHHNEVNKPVGITAENDLVMEDSETRDDTTGVTRLSGKSGEDNGYGAFLFWKDGDHHDTSYTTGNVSAFQQYGTSTGYAFTVKMPAGHHELRVYTGAWENTVNKVSLLDGDKELASRTLAKEGGGRSTLVTFDVTTADTVSLRLTINAEEGNNCRLMAISIVDMSLVSAPTTTVSVDSIAELTGKDSNTVNLSEKGNLDWVAYKVQSNGGEDTRSVSKNNADYIGEITNLNGNTGWDYKAAITWNDDDGEVNSGDCKDGDLDKGKGHNNFVVADNYCDVTVKVNANVKTITVYATAWKPTYAIAVYDSHGNQSVATPVYTGGVDGSKAFAITFAITATAEENLTVRLFKTNAPKDGSNIGIAAIAVGGEAA